MEYAIRFRPSALREFQKLPRDVQKRIAPHIDALADSPRPAGAKRLKAEFNRWRTRVGSYRVVYEVNDGLLVVLVVGVAHRRQIYR